MVSDYSAKEPFPGITSEEIENLTVTICDSFEAFKARRNYQCVEIDPFQVRSVVTSFLLDIQEISSTNDSPLLSRPRIAGCALHWFIKLKPIHCVQGEPAPFHIHSKYRTINEEFAVYIALWLVQADPVDVPLDYLKRLIFSLAYDELTLDSIILMLRQFFRMLPILKMEEQHKEKKEGIEEKDNTPAT